MTATDELCKMLDERGVEHTDAEDGHTQYTWWSDGDHEIAASNSGKRLAVYNLTPEQAIAATLGHSSNCTNSERTSDDLLPCPFCGEIPMVDCGYHYDYDGGDRYYAYSADVECCCGCTLHVEHDGPKEYVTNEHMLDFAIAAWNRRAES